MSTEPSAARSGRFVAIDVMRGFVMVLMSIDHASGELNAGRLVTDSIYFWQPGTPLPAGQFLTRWLTHLCAPTFVFLAGASLAISSESRRAAGASARSIDLHIAKRGVLLIALEILWMSWVMRSFGNFLFQVLYALGASLLAMIALRRLGDRALVGFAIAWTGLGEALIGWLSASGLRETIASGLLVSGGFFGDRRLIVAYPAIPWLAMMALGWAFGRRLLVWREQNRDVSAVAARVLFPAGAAALAAFAVLRGIDGYGNMLLHREGSSLVQWLHVSKYPPSATFSLLELGIMALALGLLFRFSVGSGASPPVRILQTIGQTALFYYLLHIHLLALAAWLLGVSEKLGLWSAYVGAAAVLALLYPACLRYRRFKAEHPTSFAQYI